MHWLPQYLYLAELFAGKRVLELGCGTGRGAWFLANHGAAQVIGIDRSQRRIEEARSRYRVSNLEFRCEPPSRIELDDNSVDCVFLPDGARYIRRGEVLDEIRRVLASGGDLVVSAASADRASRGRVQPAGPSDDDRTGRGNRPTGRSGLSYYELFERLESRFAPVRMVAQQPFVAAMLVGYGNQDDTLGVEIDTSLVGDRDDEEVTHYLALCGSALDARPRALTVVQLPTAEGLESLGAGFGLRAGDGAAPPEPTAVDDGESASTLIADALAAHAAHAAAQAAELEDNQAYIAELRDELLHEQAAASAAGERQRALEAERVGLESELAQWRKRAAVAEGKVLGQEVRDEPVVEAPATLEQELAAARRELARVTDNWHQAEAKNDDVWRRVGELQTDLERHREDAVVTASRQRQAAQLAVTRAMDEASKQLVSVQDRLLRADRKCDELAARLAGAESRNQELAGNLEEAEVERTRLEDEIAVAEGRREELELGPTPSRTRAHASTPDLERALAEREREPGTAPIGLPLGDDATAAEQALAELEREGGAATFGDDATAAEQALAELALGLPEDGTGSVVDRDDGSPARDQADAAERALAELEARLEEAAVAETASVAVSAARDLIAGLSRQVADCRTLLAELGQGLDQLHEAPRDATGRPSDSRLRELAGELGVKDAELTLLNLGLSSLQHRVQEIVDMVRASRREMAGRGTTEMLAIMDRLAESLASYG